MNARELLDEDKWGLETHLDKAYGGDICQTILRALRLLAAAEANDGTTPETDALAKLCSTQFQIAEIARSFERERNGLAARVAELEKDAERYRWLRVQRHADIAACWYLPVMPQDYPVDTPEQRDAAIDAARSKP